MYPDLAEKSAAALVTATMVLGVAPEKGYAYILPCVHVKPRSKPELLHVSNLIRLFDMQAPRGGDREGRGVRRGRPWLQLRLRLQVQPLQLLMDKVICVHTLQPVCV